MELAGIATIVGGIVSVVTIIVTKCKCFVHRTSDGRYDIVFGLLDKPLPINDTVITDNNQNDDINIGCDSIDKNINKVENKEENKEKNKVENKEENDKKND
jgi:hypothetical protein